MVIRMMATNSREWPLRVFCARNERFSIGVRLCAAWKAAAFLVRFTRLPETDGPIVSFGFQSGEALIRDVNSIVYNPFTVLTIRVKNRGVQ